MAQPQRVQVRAHQVQIGDVLTYGDVRGEVVEIESPGRIRTELGWESHDFVLHLVSCMRVGTDRHAVLHVLRKR